MTEFARTDIEKIIKDAYAIFAEEPSLIRLKSDKPLVFVGDTHGDIDSTSKVLSAYKNHRKVFLGDYVDRPTSQYGSIKNILALLKEKIRNPAGITLLRGNHEFERIFVRYDFGRELSSNGLGELIPEFSRLFSQMPYAAETKNGIIGLHGGLPSILKKKELSSLPKGVEDYHQNSVISQIVWNDITDSEGYADINFSRGFEDDHGLLIRRSFFKQKMKILGKNVLLRGHDQSQKGISMDKRLLTIFTSQRYCSEGKMEGSYVAVVDPQKEVKTCDDFKIKQIKI